MRIREIGPLALYIVVVLVATWSVGCQGSDLGRFCVVGAEPTDTAEEKLNTTAPECEQRLCLSQRGYLCADGAASCSLEPSKQVPLKPMCTVSCGQNADCGGGDVNINGCQQYVCQKPAWGTTYRGCFCSCLDYIRDSGGAPISKAAFNASGDACGN